MSRRISGRLPQNDYYARGNGGRGTRHHPPWPPLSKGGKGYAAAAPAFSRRKRWPRHASSPPDPALHKGGRGPPRHPIAPTKTLVSQSTLLSGQYQLFSLPGRASWRAECQCRPGAGIRPPDYRRPWAGCCLGGRAECQCRPGAPAIFSVRLIGLLQCNYLAFVGHVRSFESN